MYIWSTIMNTAHQIVRSKHKLSSLRLYGVYGETLVESDNNDSAYH